MPILYRNSEEFAEAKQRLLSLKRRYNELKKHLSGYKRRRYSQDEIAKMEHEISVIAKRYRLLARNINYNIKPLSRNVRYYVKINAKQCQSCGKFDGTGGASCPNCPGLPSYGKSPTSVSSEKGDWKAPDGTIISDTGSNEVNNKFDTNAKAIAHANKHINKHYPDLTMEDYTEKAARLASSSVGGNIRGFSRDIQGMDPDIVRWDISTGDFAIAVPGENGFVRTMYKVSLVYFDNQKKRDWKFRKGGK